MVPTKVVDVLLNPQQRCLLVVQTCIEGCSAVFCCRSHLSRGDEPKYVYAVVERHIDHRLALNTEIAIRKKRGKPRGLELSNDGQHTIRMLWPTRVAGI